MRNFSDPIVNRTRDDTEYNERQCLEQAI